MRPINSFCSLNPSLHPSAHPQYHPYIHPNIHNIIHSFLHPSATIIPPLATHSFHSSPLTISPNPPIGSSNFASLIFRSAFLWRIGQPTDMCVCSAARVSLYPSMVLCILLWFFVSFRVSLYPSMSLCILLWVFVSLCTSVHLCSSIPVEETAHASSYPSLDRYFFVSVERMNFCLLSFSDPSSVHSSFLHSFSSFSSFGSSLFLEEVSSNPTFGKLMKKTSEEIVVMKYWDNNE